MPAPITDILTVVYSPRENLVVLINGTDSIRMRADDAQALAAAITEALATRDLACRLVASGMQ